MGKQIAQKDTTCSTSMCSPGRCLLVLAVFVAICVLVACRFVPETPSDSASAESPSVSASASSATPDSQHTSDTSATPAPNPISTSRTSSSSNSSPDESSAPATAPDNSDSANQPKTQPTIYQYQTEERWVEGRHGRIYGLAYIPEGEGPWPLVVCSHGLGGTHLTDADYAQQLAAHGYAAYTFDFNGGSSQSKSEGSTLDMSAQTEADDLEDVMDASQNWEFVNHDKLFLFGESQGGLVSAIAASRRPQDIDALCLLFPAFVLIDYVHDEFATLENVPESFSVFGWITVGHRYAADVWDYDFESEIGAYSGPVLLVHGTADVVVPYQYSQRAAQVYPQAELHLLEGANHGFSGHDFDTTVNYMLDFFASN